MPTLETLERFIQRVEAGAHAEACEEFYTENASMQENQSAPRVGRAVLVANERNVMARTKSVESKCVRPIFVSGDNVVIRWIFRFEWRDGSVMQLEELAYQRWEGEQIAAETFFYDPAQTRAVRPSEQDGETKVTTRPARDKIHAANTSVPPDITNELFHRWRSPIRGEVNPEPMTNPVWQWLVASRLGAWQATDVLSRACARNSGPGWCFERFGQSTTLLPDGRTVQIAGEHEDFYDPDFFIYNDVVVTSVNGEIEIFGYPLDAFPPTDFHTATLVGPQIILIGNLGYPGDRQAGGTQVLSLDLDSWRMARIHTTGAGPGWLHGHDARLTDDASAILITRGQIDRCDGEALIENIDDWRLDLGTWHWQRLTARPWTRFEVRRQDRRPLHLWLMRQALTSKAAGRNDEAAQESQKLEAELGSPARLDLVPTLYRPTLAHEVLAEREHELGVERVRISGVVVRFVEDTFGVQVTVEGELPSEAVEQLRHELLEKLAALEQAPVSHRDIGSR